MTQVLSQQEIQDTVFNIATKLNEYGDKYVDPLLVGVLDGGILFFSDLIKQLIFDFEIDFVKVRSYNPQGQKTNAIEMLKSLDIEIKGRTVVLIDDFFDSGSTATCLINHFNKFEPHNIIFTALLKRHTTSVNEKFWKQTNASYLFGVDVMTNDWLYGYGLDLNGKKRNLKEIYK